MAEIVFRALVNFYAAVLSALLAFERARIKFYYYAGGE
jgi:hypothetical protein